MPTTTTGVATSFIDFTRASNATVTDSDGKVKWAPHNLLLNSESFDSASWTKNSTVTANNAAAPNSTTTAELVDEGTASGYKQIQQNVTTLAGVNYTLSVFAKYVSCRWLNLSLFDNGSSTQYGAASFDLLNGVVGTSGVAGTGYAIVGSPTMTPLSGSGGWYLCSVTVTNGTSVANRFAFSPSDVSTIGSSGLNTYTGTSKTFQAWGASLYRSDLGGMQPNTSAYPMYNPTTPKNLVGASEDFSSAAWTGPGFKAFGSGSLVNATVAPNGLQTADLWTENTSFSEHYRVQAFSKAAVNGVYTASAYFKAGFGTRNFRLAITSDTGGYGATFSTAGSIVQSSVAIGTITGWTAGTAAVDPVGNGWYRARFTATTGTETTVAIVLYTIDGTSSFYTGDGTSGIYLWGAQLSDSASLDPYVPVYGAAVTSAAYYGPRRDFDPVTLACKGLLVEEQRSNLLLYSEQFDNAAWGGASKSVSPDVAVAPSGLTKADEVTFTSNVGNFAEIGQYKTIDAGTYVQSVYIKAYPGEEGKTLTFDTPNASGSVTITLTNQWQRVTKTVTVASTTSVGVRLISYTGQTASRFYLWGAQLEPGSFSTSYIPTGAATATRLADVASVSTQAFPYSATEGTIVVNASVLSTASGNRAGATLYQSSTASITVGNNVGGGGPTTADFYVVNSGSDQAWFYFNSAVTAGAVFKVGGFFKANNFNGAANGVTGTLDTTGTVPNAADEIRIGRGAGGGGTYLNGHIRQITYLPRAVTTAELQTRTA